MKRLGEDEFAEGDQGDDEDKNKQKTKTKTNDDKSNRILITVNVLGSTGPMRFVVDGDDDAAAVTLAALKIHARQGRLPILGSDISSFSLHPAAAHDGFEVLSPSEKIGRRGERNFILCKKERSSEVSNRKGRGWRASLHKYLSLKCLSC